MTRALPRTSFNSSRLIRFLADLSIADATESKQAFAERLGQWLDFADAITLSAALGASPASQSAAQSGGQSVPTAAVDEEFARVRTALVSSITNSCSFNAGETRIKLPVPKPGATIEINEGRGLAAAYEPYRRFHLAHQREMESSVRPLRAQVREALAKASPALKPLASLDAALDQILGDRERTLLSTVPLTLEKRFEQLLKAHQQTLLETAQADDSALWLQPGGWLASFCRELQGVLLAELDVRLQPVVGLIEAFSNEANKQK